MIKTKHNKKRNTAVLYEVLVTELTKCIVEGNEPGKRASLSLIKKFFKKGKILSKELELYKNLSESSGLSDETARRLLDKVIQAYGDLDNAVIFKEQSDLLKKMNTELPKTVFTNFIPDYKSLASISQIFSKSTPVKEKVLLEQKIVETLKIEPEKKSEINLKVIDNLEYNTFVKKFNSVYGKSLLPEQKELVTKFVMSFSDNGVELKTFLNEEIGRLKTHVTKALEQKEISEDSAMRKKTGLVLERIESYKTKPIDNEVIGEVLKIQSLVKEIQD
jgi:hypothetical protein